MVLKGSLDLFALPLVGNSFARQELVFGTHARRPEIKSRPESQYRSLLWGECPQQAMLLVIDACREEKDIRGSSSPTVSKT